MLVPGADALRIGDVILCRPSSTGKYTHQIERHQRTIPRLNVGDAPTWRHAMLYVGRLHVAESTTWFKANRQIRSGVRIAPLINVGGKNDLLILRRSNMDVDYDEYRKSAAMYALTDYALSKKSYGYDRIVKMAVQNAGPLAKLTPFVPSNFEKTVICSEYVLQCLAIGGQILTEQYLSLDDDTFFYPADFAVMKTFEPVAFEYRQLGY